jgi:hypothetical protein
MASKNYKQHLNEMAEVMAEEKWMRSDDKTYNDFLGFDKAVKSISVIHNVEQIKVRKDLSDEIEKELRKIRIIRGSKPDTRISE